MESLLWACQFIVRSSLSADRRFKVCFSATFVSVLEGRGMSNDSYLDCFGTVHALKAHLRALFSDGFSICRCLRSPNLDLVHWNPALCLKSQLQMGALVMQGKIYSFLFYYLV